MTKTVPFEFFEPGQYLFFNTMRLVQLERLLHKSLIKAVREAIQEDNIGLDFILATLTIGLQHHYPHITEEEMSKKMDAYFENGGTAIDLAFPAMEAVGGIWGNNKDKETSEKNAKKVQKPELSKA